MGPKGSPDVLGTGPLEFPAAAVKAVIAFFDKVAFRSRTRPSNDQLALLRANARSVDVRTGHPIRGSDQRFIVTLTVPKRPALELADACGWMPNYVEPAIDAIVGEWAEALKLHYFLDGSFVQSWHGRQQLLRYSPLGEHDHCATTYTGQRKANRRFVWYSHHLSRITNEPCLHFESRHRGVGACRRIGIYTAADLIDFDHCAHWQRHLTCYRIDFAQLANKIAGTRRQKPNSVDVAKAGLLFRALSAHERQQMRSVQRFVDLYGRGRFLHRVDVSGLLSSIDYVAEAPKSRNRFVSLYENTSQTTKTRTLSYVISFW